MLVANATADFETQTTVLVDDGFGDEVESTEWVETLEDVPVRLTPAQVTEQTASGQLTRRPATLKAPLRVDEYEEDHGYDDPVTGHEAGDRVTVHFRGDSQTLRMIEYGVVTTFGSEGSVKAELEDWGDN